MVETQSRYGIMAELNERKIKAKQELAALEEQSEMQLQKTIDTLEEEIQSKKANYKTLHKNWKAEKELEIKMLQESTARQIRQIKELVKDRDESFEEEHKREMEEKERRLEGRREALEIWKKSRDTRIKAKKEIIEEIQNGIDSLKEMSKEQQKDEKEAK